MEYFGSLGQFLALGILFGFALHGVIKTLEDAWLALLDTIERVLTSTDSEILNSEEVNLNNVIR